MPGRIVYNGSYDYDSLDEARWYSAINRSLNSKRGLQFLEELEQALLALPEKKLISRFMSDGEGVCTLGALALHRSKQESAEKVLASIYQKYIPYTGEKLEADENNLYDNDPEDAYNFIRAVAKDLHIGYTLCYTIIEQNDDACEFASPELRYEHMLRWVQREKRRVLINLENK